MKTNEIFNTCVQTQSSIIIFNCSDSLGLYIAQSNKNDPLKIVEKCKEIQDEKHQAGCMAAAAGELIFQNYTGWQKNVKTICESLTLPLRSVCEARVEQIKKDYGRS